MAFFYLFYCGVAYLCLLYTVFFPDQSGQGKWADLFTGERLVHWSFYSTCLAKHRAAADPCWEQSPDANVSKMTHKGS
jgi:hypothetical protein